MLKKERRENLPVLGSEKGLCIWEERKCLLVWQRGKSVYVKKYLYLNESINVL